MTPQAPLRVSLALGGMFILTSSLLVSAPISSAAPSTEAVDTINDRYTTFGGESSLLGAPLGEAVDVAGGAERDYEGGTIFYSKDTGAHVMYGVILDRYEALGGPGSDLGFPKNDEGDVGDGVGRFNDFSAPEGAAIYWSPQWGASVIKGKVLEAWRQSGAITGPFGYPSADTSVTGDMQTGKFVGPEGTEIQWSKAAGLLTIPAALAAKIPGFGANAPTAEGTTSVSAAPGKTITTEKVEKKGFNWLWLLLGIPLIAGLGWLLRKRPQEVAPVRVAERAPVVKPTPPPARPAPVVKAPAPTPPAPRPPAPAPAKVAPVTKVTPPPAPKPVTPPPAPRPLLSEPPKATIRTETSEDVTTVVRYEDSVAGTETTARVTYENNALGDDQESVADKSDTIPD